MKTGKEIKTNNFKDFNVVFGSVDNKNAKAVYINISAWAEPKSNDDVNYTRSIRNINKRIKNVLFNVLDSDKTNRFLKDRTIVDLDIRESGIRYGKRSFMSCEVTLFSDTENPVNTAYVKEILNDVSKQVIDKVFKDDDNFTFHKKKK
jgi:hypothetical protein